MRTSHLIGRNAEGLRIVVDIDLRSVSKPVQTVNHWTGRLAYYELSITGNVLDRHRKDLVSCGQNREDVLAVDTFTPGWTRERVDMLVNVWTRYHLNNMNAGCVHLPCYHELILSPASRTQVSTVRNVCPVTGYRWGTAWLVEVIPTPVIEVVRDFQRRPFGDIPQWYLESAS